MATFCANALPIDNRVNRDGTPVLIPAVQKYEALKGEWNFSGGVTVSAPADARNEAAILQEKFNRCFPEVDCKVSDGATGDIRLNLVDQGVPESPEGYAVEINSDGVVINSRDVRGLYYGVQTVANLVRNATRPALGQCRIEDWPLLNKRGLYMNLRHRGVKGDLPNLLREIEAMGALKYNCAMLEFGENFPYADSPFTNAKHPFTLEDVELIKATAERHHVEIIPTLQILSHDNWLHAHPLYGQEMAEDPKKTGWSTSSCPSSELVKTVNLMAIYEQIEFFKPRYFHLSMDEISQCPWGVCPRCKDKDPKKLWQDAAFLYTDAVLKKNVTPIVYHDMFYAGATVGGDEIVGRLAENGVNVCNWDYSLDLRKSRFDYFRKAGANLWCMSYCARLGNLQILPQEMRRQGVDGILQSFWGEMRNTCDPKAVTGSGLAGFTLGGNYEWNCESPCCAAVTFDPAWETLRLTNPGAIVEAPRGIEFKPLALDAEFNVKLGKERIFPNTDAGILRKVAGEFGGTAEKLHLAVSPDGGYYAAMIGGSSGNPKVLMAFPVNSKAEYIAFSAMAGVIPHYVGGCRNTAAFTIEYEDGTTSLIPLRYNQNLICWNQEAGGYGTRFVTRFNDTRGAMVSLVCEQWKNPFPDKRIETILFHTLNTDKIPVALLAVSIGGDEAEPPAPSDEKAAGRIERWAVLSDRDPAIRVSATGSLQVNDYGNGRLNHARVSLSAGGEKKDAFLGAMTYSIVDDPTSPEKSPVLKISVPALKPDCRNHRPRLIIDMSFKRDDGGIMKSMFFDYRVTDCKSVEWPAFYLMNSEPFRAAVCGGFMEGRQDSRWHYMACPFSRLKNERDPVDFQTADTVRISFFLREMQEPFDIYIGNVGLTEWNAETARPIRAERIQEVPTGERSELFFIE